MRRLLLAVLFVCTTVGLYAQSSVTGKVTDANGQPLANASVIVKNMTRGTVTNAEGAFTLQLPENSKTLVVSLVGYRSMEVSVPSNGSVTVTLTASSTDLEEIVVTGYTRERRSTFAGSVGKVEAKAINQVPVASIDQILQGRTAGLYSTAGSGQPGAAATVVIRGLGSIIGVTTPLYVIDGVPVISGQTALLSPSLVVGGVVNQGAFASLSPSDIDHIDVLKDAAATALYGSRGANGVIVITTKRGRNSGGKITFGVKSQFGVSNRTRPKFEMMNSAQRINYEEEIGKDYGINIGPGWTYSRSNPANTALPAATLAAYDKIRDSLSNTNVDWTDIFFRQGKTQEHELSATGGSDKVSFYSSLNYFKQEGIAIRSAIERYTFRTNVDFRSDKFTAGISSSIGFSRTDYVESENTTAVSNPFAAVYYALPYEAPYINGVLVHPGLAAQYGVLDQREGTAALERLLATTNKRDELKGVLGANLRYKLPAGFSLISTLGLDYRHILVERFIDPNTFTGRTAAGQQGSFGEGYNSNLRLFANAGVNYNNRFNKHAVDVTALAEGNKSIDRRFGYTGFGINTLLPNTPAGITPGSGNNFIPTLAGGREQRGLQSVIGIGRYTYNDKYTLNLTYRVDGSSTVPVKNRWKAFYSIGGTWNAKRESFLENAGWLNELTVRASYGLTASPFGNAFDYMSTYASSRYDGNTGLSVNRVGYEDYDWEYAKNANIGFDFAVLSRRLRGTVDVYNKLTENLFLGQRLSSTTGVLGPLNVNAGKMRNRGVELTLTGDVIRKRDLNVSVGGNISYNVNRIMSLGQVSEFVSGTSIIRVGLPIGTHFIPKWAGVDPATGNPQYYNPDGTITTTYNRSVQSVAEFGSWLPKAQGGFNTSIGYKGFTVDAFFSFAAGNKRYNNEDFFNETPSFATSNQSTRMLQRWRKTGDITDIQRFNTARNFSSKDIQDASFIRFRNLNVGYTLPRTFLDKTLKGVSNATLYFQAQNLFTWTKWRGFDPEDNNNIATFEYPVQRSFTFGINLSFN